MSSHNNDWDIIDNHHNIIEIITKLNLKITELNEKYEELNKRYIELTTNYKELNYMCLEMNNRFKNQYQPSIITGLVFPNISNNYHLE